jgi:glycerol-3-phosphate dehydrogenase
VKELDQSGVESRSSHETPRKQYSEAEIRAYYDVLIIGGGINGAVSAAALSGKGARVALIDQRDFAGFTSQQSSNLGLGRHQVSGKPRLCLVRKLCLSRNHLIRQLSVTGSGNPLFLHHRQGLSLSSGCFLWAGTWVYWLFGNGFTRIPRLLFKRTIRREEPVVKTENAAGGFEYSDAYLHDNDSRFVFQFVRSAMDRGCIAANYVESLGARREGDLWVAQARDVIERSGRWKSAPRC